MIKSIKCEPNTTNKEEVKVFIAFDNQLDWQVIRSSRKELKGIFKGKLKEIYVPKEEGKFELLFLIEKEAVGVLINLMYEAEAKFAEWAAQKCRMFAIPVDTELFSKLISIFCTSKDKGGKKNEDNTY